ncbi:response regulator transcription factor [Methylocella silvestris]|uniref:DNA-binding response regulator n=1 Tax=Methylocella silvestris TaxID=199596 RepID=A0A2J7TDQ6_METSI|nr:response regulator transcription factor [Methylocella silvestris]PNG24898.1 DNA-binding response regulator [Methylocella silvestris]
MKILIADDHWIVRASLKQVVQRLERMLSFFEAATFDEAISTLRRQPDMDLMVADLIMPGFDEFAGLQRLRTEFPEVPVVVVSVHEDVEHVFRSVELGVIGYIPKSASGAEVERAFERILAGEVSFPRDIIKQSSNGASAGSARAAVETPMLERDVNSLTNREREVLLLLGNGYSVKRIAVDLNLSVHTVRVHIGNMMKKLGFQDRSATVHYAVNLANTARTGAR